MDRDSGGNRSILRDINLQLVFSVSLMAVMGVTVITPAFPLVVERFGITGQEVGLLITIFTLPGIVLTPLMGMVADIYGRRRILIPSLLVFGIFGGLCSIAGDFNVLLILRFIQGIGAASLVSLNVTIIGDIYAVDQRDRAMGYNSGVMSAGAAIFPGLGGVLALLGWNYPFAISFVAVPIGIAVLLTMKNPEPRLKEGLSKHMKDTWKAALRPRAIVLLLASLISFMVFFGAYLSYLPLFMESNFGSSSLIIGVVMSTMSISTGIVSSQLASISRLVRKRYLLQIAFLIYAISLLAIPMVHRIEFIILPLILFGFGQGLNIPVVQSCLANLVPIESRGGFISMNGLALRIGQTIGPVVMGGSLVLLGLDSVFYLGAALSFIGFLVLLLGMRAWSEHRDAGVSSDDQSYIQWFEDIGHD